MTLSVTVESISFALFDEIPIVLFAMWVLRSRTPINVIIGMTDMAMDGNLPAESRDYLQTVRRATVGLLVIVTNLQQN